MKWQKGKSEYYWFRGRYYIHRSLAFDRNPLGHWIYLASFKPSKDVEAEVISSERRDTFEQAEADCEAHYRANFSAALPNHEQEQNASAAAA
jgi:hypothetical protein